MERGRDKEKRAAILWIGPLGVLLVRMWNQVKGKRSRVPALADACVRLWTPSLPFKDRCTQRKLSNAFGLLLQDLYE